MPNNGWMRACAYCGSTGECTSWCRCAKCRNPLGYMQWKASYPLDYNFWLKQQLFSNYSPRQQAQLEAFGQSRLNLGPQVVASKNTTIQAELDTLCRKRIELLEPPMDKIEMLQFAANFLRELTAFVSKLKDTVKSDYS